MRAFFPDAAFAWVFCATLVLLTCVAAYVDTKKAIIPNRLNVLILILGLVANVVRGGWLASDSKPVWWLWQYDPGAAWLGAVDGLLFAVVGFVIVFAAMFLVWIFGLCGGGDVKLLAAVGGWVGLAQATAASGATVPVMLLVWLGSVVVLLVWTAGRVFSGGVGAGRLNRTITRLKRQNKPGATRGRGETATPAKLRMTYSLPIAVATAVVLLWAFRAELRVVPPKPSTPQQAAHHAPPASPVC